MSVESMELRDNLKRILESEASGDYCHYSVSVLKNSNRSYDNF